MSRLIVKHLPSYVTPAKLREHFEQKNGPGGTLTDVKVSSKPDGTSRRFGFVGYKTDHEALSAQIWFNRTFIDSTRISVEVIEVKNLYLMLFFLLIILDEVIRERKMRPRHDPTSDGV
jgi:multiple RNA-binding domain-containing protein 1